MDLSTAAVPLSLALLIREHFCEDALKINWILRWRLVCTFASVKNVCEDNIMNKLALTVPINLLLLIRDNCGEIALTIIIISSSLTEIIVGRIAL